MSLMLSQPKIETGAPVMAVAWFDPPAVGPGQLSFYRVTFNALEESIAWPADIKGPPNLQLTAGARGQILQPTGMTMEPRTTYNYRARSSEAGDFTVPEFTVQVYGKPITVPAARLRVLSSPPAPAILPSQLVLEMPITNLFVGQPANVRVLLPGSSPGQILVFLQVQLTGQGFIVDQGAAHTRVESMLRGGTNFTAFIYEAVMTPVTAGKLELFAQAFGQVPRSAVTLVSNGATTQVAGGPQLTLLESDPLALNARPLPKAGELPGFTGAIGAFTIEPPRLATNVLRVGDPVKLSVTVHSAGFARLVAPPPPRSPDWQILSATADGEPAQILQAQGFAVFNYNLIPMSEAARSTPPIPFSCFDPIRGTYIDLTIQAAAVTVLPGRAPPDRASLLEPASTSGEADEELALSGLAANPGRVATTLTPLQRQSWFPLVQAAPIAAFLGLWSWDRRRRFLEEHPEILVRRRARRALRRNWRTLRRAASGGDGAAFATAAVSALRVACAPHFPAEPRALVGEDVIHLLGQNEAPAGPDGTAAVVRRFFAVTDESRFSKTPANAGDLLALQAQLELVLQRLEARL